MENIDEVKIGDAVAYLRRSDGERIYGTVRYKGKLGNLGYADAVWSEWNNTPWNGKINGKDLGFMRIADIIMVPKEHIGIGGPLGKLVHKEALRLRTMNGKHQ